MSLTATASERGTRMVRANGIEIAVTDVGSGPPLVLLHGAMASTRPAWAGSPAAHVDHVNTLAQRFRVIAPDTRGSGATVHPGGPAGFDVLAEDVIALIEALDLDRPGLAGFSEGGATATLVALQAPHLVSGLVNHAGFDYFDPDAPAHQALRPVFGGSPTATSADPDAAERVFLSEPEMAAVFTTMKADYDSAQGEGYWRDYLGQFFDRSSTLPDIAITDLGNLSVPTLFLVGDRDMFCSVELACAAYRAVPAASLGVVPGTGHEINAAVMAALADHVWSGRTGQGTLPPR